MTATLPEGIITNTDSISADIEQVDEVTIEDVRRLWKVYSVNKHVLRHNSGRRLENLFWRIWGNNGRLCRVLAGSTVARLFNYISDDTDIIRTTPVPSPRARQRRLEFSEAPGRRESSSSSSSSSSTEEANEPAPIPPSQSSGNPPPRPPILKKPRGSEEGRGDGSAGGDPAQNPSSAPSRPGPSTPPPSTKTQDGSKRKRTAFVASSSSARRRPVTVRRKSSQSSGGNASSIRSPTAATIPETPSRDEMEEDNDSDRSRRGEVQEAKVGLEPSAGRSRQAGPTGSTEMEGRQRSTRAGLFTTFSTPALVSLGRGERMEDSQRRKLTALSTRPLVTKTSATLASTSTAAVGQVELGEAPPTKTSSGKGKQAAIIDGMEPLKPAATTGTTISGTSSSSAAVSEGQTHARVLLPRSKSQLSLLLERDRQNSSGGNNSGRQEQAESSSSGKKKNRKASR